MATRKNLKKTGKPKRRGAKKRKTVRKGGMWPFTKKEAPVHPTRSFDIPTPDVFFSNYIPQYKKMYKQLPGLKNSIETYILNLPRKEFEEKRMFLLKNGIVSAPESLEIQFKHVVEHEGQYPEGKPFGFEDKFDQIRANKSNEEYQKNLNIAGVIDPQSKEMSKILGNQYNKNPKDVARERVFGTEGITDLIKSFGVTRTPKMLFDFLETIKGKEIIDLSQEEKKELSLYRDYYEQNYNNIQTSLAKREDRAAIDELINERFSDITERFNTDINQFLRILSDFDFETMAKTQISEITSYKDFFVKNKDIIIAEVMKLSKPELIKILAALTLCNLIDKAEGLQINNEYHDQNRSQHIQPNP